MRMRFVMSGVVDRLEAPHVVPMVLANEQPGLDQRTQVSKNRRLVDPELTESIRHLKVRNRCFGVENGGKDLDTSGGRSEPSLSQLSAKLFEALGSRHPLARLARLFRAFNDHPDKAIRALLPLFGRLKPPQSMTKRLMSR